MRALLYVNIYYGQVLNSEHRLVYHTNTPANGSEERTGSNKTQEKRLTSLRADLSAQSRNLLHVRYVARTDLLSERFVQTLEGQKEKEESTNYTRQVQKGVRG